MPPTAHNENFIAWQMRLMIDEAADRIKLFEGIGPLGLGLDKFTVQSAVSTHPNWFYLIGPPHGDPGTVEAFDLLDNQLLALRGVPGVLTANPVFAGADNGLRLSVADEIIIRLAPQAVPALYFGADWANVRRMASTADHFILRRPYSTAQDLLAEALRSSWPINQTSQQSRFAADSGLLRERLETLPTAIRMAQA